MKVLIVGLGSVAEKHIWAIRQVIPDAEIYALRRSKKHDNYDNIINIYDVKNVINITFAIISNPTSEHANTIRKLSEFNIPLFIEKPLFDTLFNSELVTNINKKNIKTYVACNLRFLDSLQFVQENILNHRVNEVNIYCGSYLPDWRPNLDFRNIYSSNRELGGGVHIDLIHEIDYAFWIFGKPENIKKFFSEKSSLKVNAFDYANYLFEYSTYNICIQLNYYRKDAKRTLEIVCEEGTYFVDLLENVVKWNNKIVFSSKQRIHDTYLTQMRYFIEHLKDKTSFNDINEAYQILKICLEG